MYPNKVYHKHVVFFNNRKYVATAYPFPNDMTTDKWLTSQYISLTYIFVLVLVLFHLPFSLVSNINMTTIVTVCLSDLVANSFRFNIM